MLLRLLPDSPSRPQFTIINGALATGYVIKTAPDWGNAVWQHATSGARGSQGARAVAGEPDNRVVSIPIRVGPTGSVDATNLKAALLCEAVDDLRRFGGQIQWQASGQTPRQYLEVVGGAGITRESWAMHGAADDVAEVTIVASCAPYMLGDPMDTLDDFSTDTIADYTRDNASGSGSLSIAGGLLVPSATGLKRYRHTAKGYAVVDSQVSIRVSTGATLTNGVWGASARADIGGADTLLAAEIVAGTNVLRVSRYIAGAQSTLASVAFTPVASTTYWVALRLESGKGTALVYDAGSSVAPPAIGATPLASTVADLAVSSSRFYDGHAGIRIVAAHTGERYGPFSVQPFTYGGVQMPEALRLGGPVPGDAAAIARAEITPRGNTAGTPIWGLVSWLERPMIANMIWNGDFEDATVGTNGWSGATVTGVIAGTSTPSRITTAARVKYGAAALQIVTPATSGSGASFALQRRFRPGRMYAALAWLSAASSTTSVRLVFGGNSTILASGGAAALSTTPKLYAVTCPLQYASGDLSLAYLGIVVAAATATTMAADGVVLVESPIVNLAAAQASTSSTSYTVYNTPSDTPNLLPDGTLSRPFLALIGTEIVRVNAINGAVWTCDRAQEGTTAATASLGDPVIILPPLRTHFEGKGAVPAFEIIEADSYAPALSSAGAGSFSVATDANARGGNVQRWTPGTSGAQLASLVYFVDPTTLTPDDYTLGELDVEVWMAHSWATTLTGLKVTVTAQPEGGATLGPERTTREFTLLGKSIVLAGAKAKRFTRLGSIPMIADPEHPTRWRVKVALSCAGGASPSWDVDYLMLVATRARLASPTGEQNDTASATGAYPEFIPYDSGWTTTSAMTKAIREDGSSIVGAPGGPYFPDAGFGEVLEMPRGNVDFLVKLSNVIPDDPTVDSTGEGQHYYATDVHLSVTPRFTLMRGA